MMTLTVLLAALAAQETQDTEERNLATAKKAVREWDSRTWDGALASDATMTLKVTGMMKGVIRSANVGYRGREEVLDALEALYKDFKPQTRVHVHITRGADVVVMGDVSVTTSDGERATLPIALHLKFDDEGKIKHMTLAAIVAHSPHPESR